MTRNAANINALWGELLVEELVRHNITRFYISPGSRSTPLTAPAANHPNTNCAICLDERGAAFRALGYGRANGKPAVLICSSGTAGANYFPAIIEASVDRIPMIVLTADRPPELRETAANQTIRQMPFYSDYTRWQFDMPCPTPEIPPRFLLTTAAQLVSRSLSPEAGPVHLNCMFREPLAPVEDPVDLHYTDSISDWHQSTQPYTKLSLPVQIPSEKDIEYIHQFLSMGEGVLSVGRLRSPQETKAVHALATALNWPVFADICSGLRFSDSLQSMVSYHDQLLLSDTYASGLPKRILHIGDPPLSKRWLKQMNSPGSVLACLQSSPDRQDPMHNVTFRIIADIPAVCKNLTSVLGSVRKTEAILAFSKDIDIKLDDLCLAKKPISEIATARIVSEEIDQQCALFLAASMPVRDMDMYAAYSAKRIPVAANRGASGIDGTLAAACGYAEGHNRATTLMIGDLAMLHDLNSLQYLDESVPPITLVVVNNSGGGIFSFLPIKQHNQVFNPWFSTPHDFSFESAAEMFKVRYDNPKTCGEFRTIYRDAQASGVHHLIEINTDQEENLQLHRSLQEAIKHLVDTRKKGERC